MADPQEVHAQTQPPDGTSLTVIAAELQHPVVGTTGKAPPSQNFPKVSEVLIPSVLLWTQQQGFKGDVVVGERGRTAPA